MPSQDHRGTDDNRIILLNIGYKMDGKEINVIPLGF
jgi:hypothetical protein